MSPLKPSRRAFAVAGAATAAGFALAGVGLLITNDQAHSDYDERIRTMWRSGSDTDLSPLETRTALVRLATLAANSHNMRSFGSNPHLERGLVEHSLAVRTALCDRRGCLGIRLTRALTPKGAAASARPTARSRSVSLQPTRKP